MTDRFKGFLVHLDSDCRDDTAQNIINALEMVKGVAKVEPIVANYEDTLNRSRVKRELLDKMITLLE